MAQKPTPERLYFAYGSNLSLLQMASRCPTSTYHSFGVLRGYKWIIGERGYANVVKTSKSKTKARAKTENLSSKDKPTGVADGKLGEDRVEDESDGKQVDVVYGMLYILQEEDEEKLDKAEGVPYAYFKRELDVELISKASASSQSTTSKDAKGEVVKALVYVDEKRLGEGVCKEEYVARMNRGIRDAMGKGMERAYVERVLRRFVREEDVDVDGVEDPFHPEKMGDGGYEEEEGL